MPSSIEIYSPEELVYERRAITDFLNDLQARLHKFDMLIKNLSAENKVVKKNGLTLARNIVIVSLQAGPKTLPEISKLSGMPELHIKKFVQILMREGKIKEEKGAYSLG
jgi:transcription initiation factor TFIIIB Brf1 subunit/transcription initiation factor TFIIB